MRENGTWSFFSCLTFSFVAGIRSKVSSFGSAVGTKSVSSCFAVAGSSAPRVAEEEVAESRFVSLACRSSRVLAFFFGGFVSLAAFFVAGITGAGSLSLPLSLELELELLLLLLLLSDEYEELDPESVPA